MVSESGHGVSSVAGDFHSGLACICGGIMVAQSDAVRVWSWAGAYRTENASSSPHESGGFSPKV